NKGRIDLRPRREGRTRQLEKDAWLCAPLRQHGKTPVVLGTRLGYDAVGDLALEHEHESIKPGRPRLGLEPDDQPQGTDAVRQISDDAGGRMERQTGIVHLSCVRGDNIEPAGIQGGNIGQGREAAFVSFDSDDARRSFEKERAREPPGSGANLDNGYPL